MRKFETFSDKEEFKILFKSRNPDLSNETLDKLTDEMERMLRSGEKWLIVRFIIADIVENDFGRQERLEYLLSSFSGAAK